MPVWGRRVNPGLLVSKNAGWVRGDGGVFRGGLPWPELSTTSRLINQDSSSTGERMQQEGGEGLRWELQEGTATGDPGPPFPSLLASQTDLVPIT